VSTLEPTTIHGRIARAVLASPGLAKLAVLVLSVLSVLSASTLHVDSDLLNLMPEDEPSIAALKQLDAEEAGVNLMTVAVTGEQEDVDPFMRELADRLKDHPDIRYVLYDIEDELAWRLGVLNVEPDDLSSIRDRLKGALSLGPAIANPFVAGRLLDLGPMTERLKSGDNRLGGVLSSGEFSRLLIRPTQSAHHLPFAREIMKLVDGHIAELKPEERGVEIVWIGGAYRHNVEDYEGIVHDMRWTGAISLVLVFSFLTVSFRDPKAVLLVFVPLLLAGLWTFGFAGLAVGTLNSFTSFFGAILVGLGVDFSIHLYSRYREERRRSDTVEDAIVRAWDAVGPPCLAAAVTTAGGFSALMFARFQGFSQLGLILAVGVLLCLVSVLTVLPLMIRWRATKPTPGRVVKLPVNKDRPPTYRFAPLALSFGVLLTIVGIAQIPRIGWEHDLSELRRDGMAYSDLTDTQRRLVRDSYTPVVVTYPSEEALDAGQARYEAMLDDELTEIQRVVSIRSIIPADQSERLALLGEIAQLAEHESYGYLPAPIRQNLQHLVDTPLSPMTPDELPYSLQHLMGVTGTSWRLLLTPSGNMWDLRETSALLKAVEQHVTDAPAAGEFLAVGSLFDVVKADMPRVAGLALLLVCLATLLDLRQPRRALGAVSILVGGMSWAAAAVAIFGVKLSIVNIVGVPILLGIGVDVVIHLLHRLGEEGPGRVMKAMTTTGYAAVLSSTTTVLSFASLTFATNQGIRSLGLLVLVGLTSVTIAAFALVPAGWMTSWKIGGDLPDELPDDLTDEVEI